MFRLFKSHHPVRHAKSFKYAFSGILHVLFNEANFRVQVVIVVFAIILGLHFNISNAEWSLITLGMGMLLSAELINTVVEEFIDHLIKEYHEGAKIIKDMSAGFVLIMGITNLIVFAFIFGPHLL